MAKRKNWIKKHPIWSIVLGVIILIFIISIFSGEKENAQENNNVENTFDTSTNGIDDSANNNEEKIGSLIISGEEEGVCYVNEINLWSEPKSASDGAYVIGKISSACPQKTVSYFEEGDFMSSTGRIWYKVESDGDKGWITDTYVVQKE